MKNQRYERKNTNRNKYRKRNRRRYKKSKILILVVEVMLLWVVITFGILKILEVTGEEKSAIKQNERKQISISSKERKKNDESFELGYERIKLGAESLSEGSLILVNSNYSYKNKNIEEDLKSVYDCKNNCYYVKDKNVLLRKEVIQSFNNMIKRFYEKRNNNQVMIVSGYRDEIYQKDLYFKNLNQTGRAYSDTVTKPGHSEHHTGYSLDLGVYAPGRDQSYNGEGVYQWINDNSWKYGFVVRYGEDKKEITKIDYEPWHFRYVGVPHAEIMKQNNWSLEEYLTILKQYTFGKEHYIYKAYNKKTYEIYFVSSENVNKIPVPKDKKYTISGNNVDGYIVTIQK